MIFSDSCVGIWFYFPVTDMRIAEYQWNPKKHGVAIPGRANLTHVVDWLLHLGMHKCR